jgi:hypothetical protein
LRAKRASGGGAPRALREVRVRPGAPMFLISFEKLTVRASVLTRRYPSDPLNLRVADRVAGTVRVAQRVAPKGR